MDALFAEASWATVAGPQTDAFGAAYPYERRIEIMEAYGERTFRGGRALARRPRRAVPDAVRHLRRHDHGYGGFLRAPLIRYPGYWALANTFLEHGVNVMAGVPALQMEYTIGTPSDVGEAGEKRRAGADQVIRVQGYHGDVIVGATHIRTQPYQPERYARGRAVFTGMDARWMRDGFQLRGEWLDGQPFDGMHARRLRRCVPAPARDGSRYRRCTCRGARLRRRSPSCSRAATLGARVLLADGLYAQVNATRQSRAISAATSPSRMWRCHRPVPAVGAMAVSIPWHRRLEARVLAGVTAIVGVSLAALTLVTGEVVERHTMNRAEVDLAAAQAAFTHLVSTQSELVGAQTRLITGLPVFRAHMTDSRLAGDVATMEAMAEMYPAELDAAFTIVSDGKGRWLASPGLSHEIPRNVSRRSSAPRPRAAPSGTSLPWTAHSISSSPNRRRSPTKCSAR